VTIALSGSGARAAIRREVKPPRETPNMPAVPLHQGWSASQWITSTPSARSPSPYGSAGTPSELP
jgi:hypothetical protein